jgi:hypothetical protein
MGDYIPEAPAEEEARRRNGNLPGMGGVYNLVNLHVYHYAGNNPIKYTDPDGRLSADDETGTIYCDLNDKEDMKIAANFFLANLNYNSVIAQDPNSGASVTYNSPKQMFDSMERISANIDYSTVESFLESIGISATAASLVADLASATGQGPSVVTWASRGVTATILVKDMFNGITVGYGSQEEAMLAGFDMAVNVIGFAGVPGAGFSLFYTAAKKSAPSIWNMMNQVTNSYLDYLGTGYGLENFSRMVGR